MNELGFTESFLKDYMSDSVWEWFITWMAGKTTAQVNSEETYYYWDVETFCEMSGYDYPY